MIWATSGEEITIPVELKMGGDFTVPDAGSIKMTLRASDGTILKQADLEDTQLSVLPVVIGAEYNTLGDGVDLAVRFLRVDWAVAGKPLFVFQSYSVTPPIFLTYGPQEVRTLLGATPEEFPDDAFNLLQAYLTVKETYASLDAMLQGTGRQMLAAHKAVGLQAALDTRASWPMRFMTLEQEEQAKQQRAGIDFEALERSLRAQLMEETTWMESASAVTPAVPAMLALATPTDIITNT